MNTITQSNINTILSQRSDTKNRQDPPNVETVDKGQVSAFNQNFDNFLQLLTTQLRYQDPTNPVDSHEFTNQLVLFSGVEQQIRGNDYLNKLVERLEQSSRETATNYLGKEIEVPGQRFRTETSGQAVNLHYVLEDNANDVYVEIFDSNGRSVSKLEGGRNKGDQFLTWEGVDASGNPVPPGTYSYRVTAVDADGLPVGVQQFTTVRIAGVGYEDGKTYLIGETGDSYPIEQITALRDNKISANQLQNILEEIKGLGDNSLLQYVGRSVEFEQNKVIVDGSNGASKIRYSIEGDDAKSTIIKVLDAQNQEVKRLSVATGRGSHTYTWDHNNDQQQPVPPGEYRIYAETENDNGESIPTFIYIQEQVVSLDLEAAPPSLVTSSGRNVRPTQITRLLP